jgi:hypothetical protein
MDRIVCFVIKPSRDLADDNGSRALLPGPALPNKSRLSSVALTTDKFLE